MTNRAGTNPDPKPRASRKKKPIAQDDDLTPDERRAIRAAKLGGAAETVSIRVGPLLREASALAMTAHGLPSLSEYVNYLLARDCVKTMLPDFLPFPGSQTNALDFVLGEWAEDARRRTVNRAQLLPEQAIPTGGERMQADALRSFMKSAAAKAGRPLSREQLADAALEEWDAIHATIGPKHIDRTALAACAARAAESLRTAPLWPAQFEEYRADAMKAMEEAAAKGVPPEAFLDALTAAIRQAAKEIVGKDR
ncbi:hypothetical protein QTI33_03645 [Variovorax sp. J22P271]|uniref:hypothetical protein n=1 Tax=Variovorax davisae TaxID=3053515 RepID=UPI002575899F|nr:hypothetical protein [Variovorax sp. J22P271]MDM0031228.1 hypothetical protein [Variovorax sp. J22P271]